MSKASDKKRVLTVVTTIVGLGVSFVMVFPIIWLLMSSFKDSTELFAYPLHFLPENFSLDSYKNVIGSGFFQYVKNSLFLAVVGTLITLAISAMCGYGLAIYRHEIPYSNKVFAVFLLGTLIPGEILTVSQFTVISAIGLYNNIWGVILPGAVSTWNFIVMRSFFDNYPSEIEESGKVDGLTDAGVFFRLVLPTSKAVLATIGLYYAVSLWNAYFIPFIYLNDPDLFSLQLILHELLSAGSSNNATVGVGDVLVVEESLKYATVLVSIAPIMCVYPFLQKYFVKGVTIGAVKG